MLFVRLSLIVASLILFVVVVKLVLSLAFVAAIAVLAVLAIRYVRTFYRPHSDRAGATVTPLTKRSVRVV